MTSPLTRLSGHGLSAPTGADFRAALDDVTDGDAEEIWTSVCQRTGVPHGAYLLDLDQADALAAALTALPGLPGLAGRTMGVRVASYRALAHRQGSGGSATDLGRSSLQGLLRGRLPEPGRLAEIADLDLFSAASRARLDRAAELLAERSGARVGLVTVVLEGSQHFAGSHGLTGWGQRAGGTPVEWSSCATVVRTRLPYVVPDARQDAVQRTNPVVVEDDVVMYAGVPLVTSRGHVLGAYCVVGDEPRRVSDEELGEFRTWADEVVADLERDRLSTRRAGNGCPAAA